MHRYLSRWWSKVKLLPKQTIGKTLIDYNIGFLTASSYRASSRIENAVCSNLTQAIMPVIFSNRTLGKYRGANTHQCVRVKPKLIGGHAVELTHSLVSSYTFSRYLYTKIKCLTTRGRYFGMNKKIELAVANCLLTKYLWYNWRKK